MNTATFQTRHPVPVRALPRRPFSSPAAMLLRGLLDRIDKAFASRNADVCHATGAHHRVTIPVNIIGGQGRPWKLYGPCDLCGKTASAPLDPI